jgi:hypothetical protein
MTGERTDEEAGIGQLVSQLAADTREAAQAEIALAKARGLVQAILLTSIILPLSVGIVVKAFAWQIVLRRDGVISMGLQSLGLVDEPLRLLFTETGLVIGAVNVFLPFMILPLYSVVSLIDPPSRRGDHRLHVTRQMASPCHRPPHRLDPPLPLGHVRVRRQPMLAEQQPPIGFQGTPQRRQRAHRIRNGAQRVGRHDRIH